MTTAAQPRAGARAFVPTASAPAQLEFVRNTADSPVNQQYYRVSTCGRYSVSKCIVAGTEVYDAWRVRGENQAEHLGTRKSAVGAMGVCQRHLDGQS